MSAKIFFTKHNFIPCQRWTDTMKESQVSGPSFTFKTTKSLGKRIPEAYSYYNTMIIIRQNITKTGWLKMREGDALLELNKKVPVSMQPDLILRYLMEPLTTSDEF